MARRPSTELHPVSPEPRGSTRRVGILYQGGGGSSIPDMTRQSRSLAVCGSNSGSTPSKLLSCGYWDQSIRIHNLDSAARETAAVFNGHLGQITAVCSGMDVPSHVTQSALLNTVITGGVDGTCRVWLLDMNYSNGAATSVSGIIRELSSPGCSGSAGDANPALTCIHILWGHETPIATLHYSHMLDLVVSASVSGLICLHTARNGCYIRSLGGSLGRAVEQLYICPRGYIAVFSTPGTGSTLSPDTPATSLAPGWLESYWVNGQLLHADQGVTNR